MPNRLAGEISPYLLQHQNNPVDWRPWGPEAFAKAKAENKPVFLSIGYAACHWCHVMEHESFENPELAALLNEHFVSIKVDREERPDLDQIYMNAVQLLTGRGGWPMSVFLTPEGEPFYGGTYWPPSARTGMPGFDQILQAVQQAWTNRNDDARQAAAQLTDQLRDIAAGVRAGSGELSPALLDRAGAHLARVFDRTYGGFGSAPKFPHSLDLQVLLRVARRQGRTAELDMVRLTLDKMAAGGMYDHLGGGFARYSVDERWLVPHFEKMLYDNALLAVAYLEGYQATGEPRYAQVVRETLDYLLRDMTDPAGGFYSSEDADSEGEEGKFYVWTPEEIEAVLGPAATDTFAYVYDVTLAGNFEGHNILNLPKTIVQCAAVLRRDPAELAAELSEGRAKLLAARSQRVRPGRDDKVLVSWNGLAIEAFARAGAVLNEPRYVAAARRAAEFLLTTMRRPDGRLYHGWRAGQARLAAYLDDYAALAVGLLALYEATFDEQHLDDAAALVDVMLRWFADDANGGFFYTASDHETLIARTKDQHDSSVPSGTALAAMALVRLARLTGQERYRAAAEATLRSASGVLEQSPAAAGELLLALALLMDEPAELVLLAEAPEADELIRDYWRRFLPGHVLVARGTGLGSRHRSPLMADVFTSKERIGKEPTLYVCQNFACRAPVVGEEKIREAIKQLAATQVP